MAGKRLPRATSFYAALYSIGLPPELLGLADLKSAEINLVSGVYPNFFDDLHEAGAYYDQHGLPSCRGVSPMTSSVASACFTSTWNTT